MTIERKIFDPGVYTISNEEYHNSAGISRTGIMEFKKSAKHYWHKYINPNYKQPEETPAMRMGNALHTALLEPGQFYNRYAVEEKVDRRTKVGRALHECLLEEHSGKTILTTEENKIITDMCESIANDYESSELIKDAQYEKSIYWIDPDTQLLCKTRPDVWHKKFIVDYKTANCASEKAFQYALYDYGYYLQAAMMHEAFKHVLNIEMLDFVFLVQEKTEPYVSANYPLDLQTLQFGISEFKQKLIEIKECLEENKFPGYPTKMISLSPYQRGVN